MPSTKKSQFRLFQEFTFTFFVVKKKSACGVRVEMDVADDDVDDDDVGMK